MMSTSHQITQIFPHTINSILYTMRNFCTFYSLCNVNFSDMCKKNILEMYNMNCKEHKLCGEIIMATWAIKEPPKIAIYSKSNVTSHCTYIYIYLTKSNKLESLSMLYSFLCFNTFFSLTEYIVTDMLWLMSYLVYTQSPTMMRYFSYTMRNCYAYF